MGNKDKKQSLSSDKVATVSCSGKQYGINSTKRKILLSTLIIGVVLIALGIAGFVYFDGFSESQFEKTNETNNTEISIEDSKVNNSNNGQETLEDQRNQWYSADYFTGKVKSLQEAAEATEVIGAYYGSNIELREYKAWECGEMHFYKLLERYEDLDVYGRSVTVVTDSSDDVVGASSNCIALDSLTVENLIESDDAETAAVKYAVKEAGYDEECVGIGKVIKTVYSIECDPAICWQVEIAANASSKAYDFIFVDANTGDIRGTELQTYYAESQQTTATGQQGAEYNLNVTDYDGTYYLQDNERNIYVHSLKNHEKYEDLESINDEGDWPKGTQELCDVTNKSGVDALGNIANTYDFYEQLLDWKGYDNNNSPLNVYVDVDCNKVNAFWQFANKLIAFIGTKNGVQYSCNLDIVAHEYTHAVTDYTSNLASGNWDFKYGTSPGAINESLSDIMGEAVEKYVTGKCNWKVSDRKFNNKSKYTEGGEVHDNAEFIDHIAYLIGDGQDDVPKSNSKFYQKNETKFFDGESNEKGDIEKYSKFWFRVQGALPPTASLDQLATVAASIAKSMYGNGEITKAQYKGILWAFERNGLDTERIMYPNEGKEDSDKYIASCIVLASDVSGSMNDNTSVGSLNKKTKLQVAQSSSRVLIEQIKRISNKYKDQFLLGVVSFSDEAAIKAVPSADMEYVEEAVKNLSAEGGTNIAEGINGAWKVVDFLDSNENKDNKAIILLSDGDDTYGNSDEYLIELAQDVADDDIKIYTIGFGDKGTFNEELLKEIAITTGGEYGWASPDSAISLVAKLLHAQADSTGKVLDEEEGDLSEGETSKERTFSVNNDTGDLSALLYWPGSEMETILIDPEGERVTTNYEGADIDDSTIPTEIVVKDPKPGKWNVSVNAKTTSQKKEPYYSLVSFRQFDRVTTAELTTTMRIIAVILPIGIILSLISLILLMCYSQSKRKQNKR